MTLSDFALALLALATGLIRCHALYTHDTIVSGEQDIKGSEIP